MEETQDLTFPDLSTCLSVISGNRIVRHIFFANKVAAVRIITPAGTIAVSAPTPPTKPRNHAGKLLHTKVSIERSQLGRQGTTRVAASPTKNISGIVML
jgi:hypothetical protein